MAKSEKTCDATVSWWGGEYEGDCELSPEHDGDHFDGISWWDDDERCTDEAHEDWTTVPTEMLRMYLHAMNRSHVQWLTIAPRAQITVELARRKEKATP